MGRPTQSGHWPRLYFVQSDGGYLVGSCRFRPAESGQRHKGPVSTIANRCRRPKAGVATNQMAVWQRSFKRVLIPTQKCPTNPQDFHPNLTHVLTLTCCFAERQETRSDRRGNTECHQALSPARVAVHKGDRPPHGPLAQHHPQVPARRRGRAAPRQAGQSFQAQSLRIEALGLAQLAVGWHGLIASGA